VLAAAGTRTESRGCHRRTDFPPATTLAAGSLEVVLDARAAPAVRAAAAVAA
jgi:L-aspartate oxidase